MVDFGSIAKFAQGVYGTASANKALNGLDNYKQYGFSPEAENTYTEATKRYMDPFSAESDMAFEGAIRSFVGGSLNRSVNVDPDMGGVSRVSANNRALTARNRRAQAGDQLSSKYFSIATDLAKTAQQVSNANVTEFNSRLFEEEQALGKAKSDAVMDTFGGVGSMLNGGDMLSGLFSKKKDDKPKPQGPAGDYDGDTSFMDSFAGGGGGGFGWFG